MKPPEPQIDIDDPRVVSKKIAHVTWIDSSCTTGWEQIRDIDQTFHEIHSVGFLITSDPDRYVLAVSYDPESESANGIMQIPTSCIQKVEILLCLKT